MVDEVEDGRLAASVAAVQQDEEHILPFHESGLCNQIFLGRLKSWKWI